MASFFDSMHKSKPHGTLATLPATTPLCSSRLGEATPLAAGRGVRGNHVCSECGKGFANQSSLNKHWAVHSDARPYQCLECGKCFKRYDHLSGHLGTHRGEKPHACTVNGCCKRYSDPRSLKRHLEKHHCGDLVPAERRKKMRCESNDWAAAAVSDLVELFGNVSQTPGPPLPKETDLPNTAPDSAHVTPDPLPQPPSGSVLLPSPHFLSATQRPVPSAMSHSNDSSPASPCSPQQMFDRSQVKPCYVSSQLAQASQPGSPWLANQQGALVSPGAMSCTPQQTANCDSPASLFGLGSAHNAVANSIFRSSTAFDLTPSLPASMTTPVALSDCSGATAATMSQSLFSLCKTTGDVFSQASQPPSSNDCNKSCTVDSISQEGQANHFQGMPEGLQTYPEKSQLSLQISSAHAYNASGRTLRPSPQQINRLVQEYHLSLAQLACLPPMSHATAQPAWVSEGLLKPQCHVPVSSSHIPMAQLVGNGQASGSQLLTGVCATAGHLPYLHNTKVETVMSMQDWRSGQG